MSLFRRLSTSSALVELGQDDVVSSSAITTAIATYRIDASVGTYSKVRTGNINDTRTVKWGIRGDFSTYYVRATLISGALTSGTFNTWQQTNVNRSWSATASSGNFVEGVINIELSNRSDGSVVLDSHQVTISATSTGGV
jgi:hypothetical protein